MAISGGQQRLDWYAVPGVPLTIVLDTADGADWSSAPIVHVGPIEADGDITPVIPAQTATITATASRATLTLTDAQMAAILTAYPVAARTACPWHVRLGTGESELAVSTGHIIWDTTGRMVTASAQLVVGPAGLTAVSADAGNAASLGTDGLIYVAPGAGTVSSVNGQTGAVVLGAADVGADAAGTAAAAVAALDIPAAAYPVQQVTLSGNLAYSLPVDAPTDQVIGVVFSQDGTGGHTVTYGGIPLTVDTAAGAQTEVELWPNGTATRTVVYPGAAGAGVDAEAVQDIVGAMVVQAGGSYNDGAGTITLPTGGGGAVSSVNGQTGAVTLTAASVGADPAGTAASVAVGGMPRALSLVAAKLANADTAPFKVLFLGDSLTWSGSAWVDLCVKRLGQAVDQSPRPTPLKSRTAGDVSIPASGIYAVNSASDGASSGNYLATNNAVAMATALQPALIVHGVGTNDFLGSMGTSTVANGVRNAITALDAACTAPPVHVFWWFGSNYGDKPYTSDQYITALLGVAAEDPGRRAVVDLGPYADTLDVHDLDPYGLDGGDTIHLSPAGYRMIGELMARALLAAPPVGVLGWTGPAPAAPADSTAPAWSATLTTGTPTQTSVVVAASALATDAVGVTGYDVSINAGSTWTPITPSGLNFTITGLTASTGYPAPQFRAKDAAGNTSTALSAQPFTTAASGDTTNPVWSTTFTMGTPTSTTVTATAGALATDNVAVTGYEVSYDGGTSYATITPSGSVFSLTGTASTTYSTTKLRAFDAAGNRSTPPLDVPSYTMAAPAGVTFGYLGSAAITSNASAPRTFAGMSLGAESPSRTIIVAVLMGGQFMTGVTVAGVTVTKDVEHNGGSTSTAWIGRATVPTGTTGDVVVSHAGSIDRVAVALWSASGAVTAASTDTISGIQLTTVAGDFCVIAEIGAVTNSWAGATRRAAVTMGSGWPGSFADVVAAGTSVSASTSTPLAMAGVAYRPA